MGGERGYAGARELGLEENNDREPVVKGVVYASVATR